MNNFLYIAGPMTGLEDYNYSEFDQLASALRDQGYVVLNPAESFYRDQDLLHREYMRGAIHLVLQAQAIVLMSGWENSRGARMEAFIAARMGLAFYGFRDGRIVRIATPDLEVDEPADIPIPSVPAVPSWPSWG